MVAWEPPVAVGSQSRHEADEGQHRRDPDHPERCGHGGDGLADGAARRIVRPPELSRGTGRPHEDPGEDQGGRQAATQGMAQKHYVLIAEIKLILCFPINPVGLFKRLFQ